MEERRGGATCNFFLGAIIGEEGEKRRDRAFQMRKKGKNTLPFYPEESEVKRKKKEEERTAIELRREKRKGLSPGVFLFGEREKRDAREKKKLEKGKKQGPCYYRWKRKRRGGGGDFPHEKKAMRKEEGKKEEIDRLCKKKEGGKGVFPTCMVGKGGES